MPARICQVAMCTSDIPATTRTCTKGLGFASAGGRPLWGERIARIQGLPTGADTAFMLWWLVGGQDFMQLELFTHTTPPQRPRLTRPNDLGWVRWGVEVDDFDGTVAALRRGGVELLSEPLTYRGRRHGCFRETGAGVLVEVIEADPVARRSDRQRFYDLAPRVRYVAASVADLARTRELFVEAGLTEVDSDTLHSDEHEALWGLAGARRDVAVLTDGDVELEFVRYVDPPGAPPPADRLLSDQGLMNVALGFRDHAEACATFDRLVAVGCTAPAPVPDVAGGTYLTTPVGLSVELLIAPRELDSDYGFRPMPRFPRPLTWPRQMPAGQGAR